MNKNVLNKIKCKKNFNFDMEKFNSYRLKFYTECIMYPENIQQLKDIIITWTNN